MSEKPVRKYSVVILLFQVFLLLSISYAGDVPRIEGDELKGLLGDPEVVILDVRRESAWSRSDIKVMGAIRENPEKFDSWVDKYPKDKTVVLYCT